MVSNSYTYIPSLEPDVYVPTRRNSLELPACFGDLFEQANNVQAQINKQNNFDFMIIYRFVSVLCPCAVAHGYKCLAAMRPD